MYPFILGWSSLFSGNKRIKSILWIVSSKTVITSIHYKVVKVSITKWFTAFQVLDASILVCISMLGTLYGLNQGFKIYCWCMHIIYCLFRDLNHAKIRYYTWIFLDFLKLDYASLVRLDTFVSSGHWLLWEEIRRFWRYNYPADMISGFCIYKLIEI